MTSIVKSVEVVTLSLTTSTIQQADLTKGQDETMCVPISTHRNSSDATDSFPNRLIDIWFDDNAGTARINASRLISGTAGTLELRVFVVEFDSTYINIYTGTTALSGTTATSSSFTAVDQTKAFPVTVWEGGTNAGDDHNDFLIRTRFASDTQLTLERGASLGTLTPRWWVVECKNTEFSVQYKQVSLTSAATSNTASLTSIDTGKTFVIGSHTTSESSDDMRDGEARYYLTSATVLSLLRDSGGTPAATIDADIFVVTAESDEFTSERYDVDVGTALSTTQAITAIDQDNAILVPGYSVGQSTGTSDSTLGSNNDDRMHELRFSADNEVTIQRRADTSINHDVAFTVVEWRIGGATTIDNTIIFAIGLAESKGVQGLFIILRLFALGFGKTKATQTVFNPTINFTLGLRDLCARAIGVAAALSFGIGLSDSKIASRIRVAAISFGLGLRDLLVDLSFFNPTIRFGLGLRDVLLTRGIFNLVITFGIGFRDILAGAVEGISAAIAFAVGFTDTKASQNLISVSRAFGLGLRDTLSPQSIFAAVRTFAVGFAGRFLGGEIFENTIAFTVGFLDVLTETARHRWELTERAIVNWVKSVGISGIWNKTERTLTGWTKNPDTSDAWSKMTDSDDTWKKTEED